MNAERLHAIARALRDDLAGTGVLASLQQLRDALQNQVNAPQEASYQQQVATSLEAVIAASEASATNEYPATWVEALEELEVDRLLGRRLGTAVREIFERNQITPSVAATEVGELCTALEAMSTRLDQLVAGLEHFGIGAEALDAGQAEVGVLIPRGAVNNHLDELGGEFQRLQKLLGPFLELGTGSRPPIEVVTISSTDFGVFLDVAPKPAMFVAVGHRRTRRGGGNGRRRGTVRRRGRHSSDPGRLTEAQIHQSIRETDPEPAGGHRRFVHRSLGVVAKL